MTDPTTREAQVWVSYGRTVEQPILNLSRATAPLLRQRCMTKADLRPSASPRNAKNTKKMGASTIPGGKGSTCSLATR